MRSPDEEPALLDATARIVGEADAVVSFFGKSFDRHRLEDKMRIAGVEPPFEGRPHLDLYHPLRRLYGPAHVDGKLQTMERALTGVVRTDDLPGSFAPAAWHDFLAGRGHRLEDVFQHNADDVLSLVVLTAHLGRSLAETRGDGSELGGPARERAAGLARSHRAVRARQEELAWLERALERPAKEAGGRGVGTRSLELERAHCLRLARRADEAIDAYRALARTEDAFAAQALAELAKLLEHSRRDTAGALEACASARRAAERHTTGALRARLEADLARRVGRLEGRADR
jgi:hypothetical protein